MALSEAGEKKLGKTPIASLCSFLLDNEQRAEPRPETKEEKEIGVRYKSLPEAFGDGKGLMRFIQLEHLPNHWKLFGSNASGRPNRSLYDLMQEYGADFITRILQATKEALLIQRRAASHSQGIRRTMSAVRDIFRREPDRVILNELKQINDQLDKINALIKIEDLIIEWFAQNTGKESE